MAARIDPKVAKFDFQGQLLENGKQVITGVNENIEITINSNPDTDPAGTLEIINVESTDSESNEDTFSSKHLKMNLTLPKGPVGPTGSAPSITAVATAATTPQVSVKTPGDGDLSEYDYVFNFGIPRGLTGNDGKDAIQPIPKIGNIDTTAAANIAVTTSADGSPIWTFNLPMPKITVCPNIKTDVDTAAVEDIQIGNDVQLKFNIPKGKAGAPARFRNITVTATDPDKAATVASSYFPASNETTSNDTPQIVDLNFSIPRGYTPSVTATPEYDQSDNVTRIGTRVTFSYPDSAGITPTSTSFVIKDGTLTGIINSPQINWTIEEIEEVEKGRVPSNFIDWRENNQDVPVEQIDGVLPVTQGGTGLTASPSMIVNLGSTDAADIFTATPSPGVAGVLPIEHGGTGASTAAAALTNLGIEDKVNEIIEDVIYIGTTTPTSNNTKIWIRTVPSENDGN